MEIESTVAIKALAQEVTYLQRKLDIVVQNCHMTDEARVAIQEIDQERALTRPQS